MYPTESERSKVHGVLVVLTATVYIAITCTVSLFHIDDYREEMPSSHGGGTAHSEPECPACKFLAGSNATEAQCDSTPTVTQVEFIPAPPPHSGVAVASLCVGSIILRGPPILCLS